MRFLNFMNSSLSKRSKINEAIKSGTVSEFNKLILKSGDSLGYIKEYIDQIAKYKQWAMLETLSQMLDKMDRHYDYLYGSSPWDHIKWNHEFALLPESVLNSAFKHLSEVRDIFNNARPSGAAAVSKESDLSLLGNDAEQSASTMRSLPGNDDVDVESNLGIEGVELKSLLRTSTYSVAAGVSVFKGRHSSHQDGMSKVHFDSELRHLSR